jgi:predicted secreted protein
MRYITTANSDAALEMNMLPSTSVLKKLIRLVKSPRIHNSVNDIRGGRFVAVIDCIINQNARDSGAARFPAMNFELLQLCHEHEVGVLQMPCPEIAALGFKRSRERGQTIRDALDTVAGRQRCAEIASDVVNRIEAYLAQGYVLLAILGGNPRSPGCAVLEQNDGLHIDSGVFMKELQAELRTRSLEVCFKAIRDHDPVLLEQDLKWFRDLLTR